MRGHCSSRHSSTLPPLNFGGEPRQPRVIGFSVTKFDKIAIVSMGPDQSPGVLDGAPIALRASHHFLHETNHARRIRAVGTVDFLKQIEIGEVIAVKTK